MKNLTGTCNKPLRDRKPVIESQCHVHQKKIARAMKQQRVRRIDDFFHQVPTQQPQPYAQSNYFYIDWTTEPYRAQWMRERPVPLDFEANVAWKALGRIVTVCCVVPEQQQQQPVDNALSSPQIPPPEALYQDKTMVSLLKSNLQKCVRRQIAKRAAETARYLMDIDLCLLVRRLAIIMLEDVVPHESFSALVWLTAALSKQFTASARIKEWLLGLVDVMCHEPLETYWSCRIDNTIRGITSDTVKAQWRDVARDIADDDTRRNTCFSLLFRLSYGGLDGDLSMLLSYVALLRRNNQPQQQQHISVTPVPHLSLSEVRRLDLSFTELCAVDFHCMPGLLFVLTKKYTKYNQQQIKQAVWHHNSKLNKRVVMLPPSEKEKAQQSYACYHTIKWKLAYHQQEHIKCCANMAYNQQYVLDMTRLKHAS
jgi:hypothetical protein